MEKLQNFLTKFVQLKLVLVSAALVLFTGICWMFLYGGDARDNLVNGNYRTAFYQYLERAEANDHEAQNVVGNLYFLGLGINENRAQAARWYLRSALGGFVPAQVNLGNVYYYGSGIKRNPIKAIGWFYIAKKMGSERAEKHIRYMILANDVLPSMIQLAKRDFNDLSQIREKVNELGEMNFLVKEDWAK